jgi:hypothetical protein
MPWQCGHTVVFSENMPTAAVGMAPEQLKGAMIYQSWNGTLWYFLAWKNGSAGASPSLS